MLLNEWSLSKFYLERRGALRLSSFCYCNFIIKVVFAFLIVMPCLDYLEGCKERPLQAVGVGWAICLRVARRPKEPRIVPGNGPRRPGSGSLQPPLALKCDIDNEELQEGKTGGCQPFSRGALTFCTCLVELSSACSRSHRGSWFKAG